MNFNYWNNRQYRLWKVRIKVYLGLLIYYNILLDKLCKWQKTGNLRNWDGEHGKTWRNITPHEVITLH